jgi:hypothetical protein
VACTCEYHNESPFSIKGREFLEKKMGWDGIG